MMVKWRSAVTVLLVGIFVVVRLVVLAVECLDGDEIFSLEVARQSWPQLWAETAHDVSHPPLFYTLLKLWIAVGGDSLTWLRLLPTMSAIAALIPFWGLCLALGIRSDERDVTLALMTLNEFLLFYTAHLRMFSLLQLSSLCSLWAFARWLDSPCKGWRTVLALVAANIFVIYSHYWGWVLVGCEGLYLLAFARRAVFKYSMIVCALAFAYIPWVLAVVQAATAKGSYTSQVSWITRPNPADFVWFYATLHGGFPIRRTTSLGLALFGVPVILWAWAAIKRGERCEAFRFLTWFAVLPVSLTFIASLVLPQSVWATRSLIISVVPYMMLVSVAARRLHGRSGVAVPLLLAAWAMISGVLSLLQFHKVHWDVIVAQIASAEAGTPAPAPVPIYTAEAFIAGPLEFYIKEQGTTNRLRIEQIDPEEVTHVNEQHVWFVYREFSWTKKWLFDRRPEVILANQGYRIGRVVQVGTNSQHLRAVPAWRNGVDNGG